MSNQLIDWVTAADEREARRYPIPYTPVPLAVIVAARAVIVTVTAVAIIAAVAWAAR